MRIESQRRAIEIKKLTEEIENSVRLKSDFMATMSHEIRTPLNGILGSAGLLFDTKLTEEQRTHLVSISSSGKKLLMLINGILDYSKIEAGQLELEDSVFSLSNTIQEAVDLCASEAAAKKIEVLFQVNPHMPDIVVADATRFREMVSHLVENAIKFTEKGYVRVVLGVHNHASSLAIKEAYPTQITVSVEDTGIGIPGDQQERIFALFTQGDASLARRHGGTGLGLAICKHLAKLMGGDIRVESRLDVGSTFTFWVNVAPPPAGSTQVFMSSTWFTQHSSFKGVPLAVCVSHQELSRSLMHQCTLWGFDCKEIGSAQELNGWFQALKGFGFESPGGRFSVILDEALWDEVAQMYPQVLKPRGALILTFHKPQKENSVTPWIPPTPTLHLQKPIRIHELYEALKHSLEGPSPTGTSGELIQRPQVTPLLGHTYPMHILVAEDNVINQKLIFNILKKMGYYSDIVANGKEVLHAIQNKNYHIILMDVQMPEMDGIEATRLIMQKNLGDLKPTIIAMTANIGAAEKNAYASMGMDDYVSKPIDVKQLRATLEKWGHHWVG